jgi:hypothetical protein
MDAARRDVLLVKVGEIAIPQLDTHLHDSNQVAPQYPCGSVNPEKENVQEGYFGALCQELNGDYNSFDLGECRSEERVSRGNKNSRTRPAVGNRVEGRAN